MAYNKWETARERANKKKRYKQYGKMEKLLKDWYGDESGRTEIRSYLPEVVSIDSVLDKILNDVMGPKERKLVELKKNWELLVGNMVSKYSEPVSIKYKILTIEVKNSALLMELRNFQLPLLEKKIKSFCGDDFYSKISFKLIGR